MVNSSSKEYGFYYALECFFHLQVLAVVIKGNPLERLFG